MRLFARSVLVLWFVFASDVFVAAQTPSRPNILVILIDDLRWDALGVTGHSFFKSPNIDRIANEGVLFQNAFVTHSLCSPSRATLLTGLYSHQHGVIDNNTPLPTAIQTVPQILRAEGYETALIGKWHMGDSNAQPQPGFDRWISFMGQGHYLDPLLNVDGREVRATGHMTDILTDYALDFLDKDHSNAFLLILSHKAVHEPIVPQQKFVGFYSTASVALPPTWNEDLSNKPSFLQHHLFSGNLKAFTQRYYESLAGVEESAGKVLAKLEQKNLLDNTLVIFTSDSGFLLGEHHLREKRVAYEESIRIPLLMRYPKWFAAGSKVESMALNLDIAQTILEAAGVTKSYNMQGLSLHKLADREVDREAFLFQYYVLNAFPATPAIRAIRTRDYKYITYLNTNEIPELYDLKNDSLEIKNRLNDPAYSQVLQRLRFQLDSLRQATGDTFTNTVIDDRNRRQQFTLYQNYPNPFNPTTTIHYTLLVAHHVSLRVYNIHGQEVATVVDEFQKAGMKSVAFDASQLAGGIYFCRLVAGSFVATTKMIAVK